MDGAGWIRHDPGVASSQFATPRGTRADRGLDWRLTQHPIGLALQEWGAEHAGPAGPRFVRLELCSTMTHPVSVRARSVLSIGSCRAGLAANEIRPLLFFFVFSLLLLPLLTLLSSLLSPLFPRSSYQYVSQLIVNFFFSFFHLLPPSVLSFFFLRSFPLLVPNYRPIVFFPAIEPFIRVLYQIQFHSIILHTQWADSRCETLSPSPLDRRAFKPKQTMARGRYQE
jgi:hypothetical protein